ncbi:MAG: hypothetical protein MUF18_04075 [Fimbriiglobus sp.]|jgi:hypothetical protein|nr:hypothetical protein [Fimbriiglobus sp.]
MTWFGPSQWLGSLVALLGGLFGQSGTVQVYEVWHTPKGKAAVKFSDAESKAKAEQVAKAIRTLGDAAEVKGPVNRVVPPKVGPAPPPDDNLSSGRWFDKNQAKYPTSNLTSELTPAFGKSADAFIKAMRDAGATVRVSVTYRSEERAYLMHYAYKIAKGQIAAKDVPAKAGVNIKWDHGDAAASRKGAQEMVDKFGIVYPPALNSNHSKRTAIDMTISWTGVLKITGADGKVVEIKSTPRTGAANTELHAVGAGYGLKKLVGDGPHWSENGN